MAKWNEKGEALDFRGKVVRSSLSLLLLLSLLHLKQPKNSVRLISKLLHTYSSTLFILCFSNSTHRTNPSGCCLVAPAGCAKRIISPDEYSGGCGWDCPAWWRADARKGWRWVALNCVDSMLFSVALRWLSVRWYLPGSLSFALFSNSVIVSVRAFRMSETQNP